jgi:N-acetylneuraminate synthase
VNHLPKRFRVGDRDVGDGCPVFIVAELSANHGGSLEAAIRTIEMAAEVGADAIKLQTYTPDTLTLKSDAPAFVVRTKNEWAGRTLHDLYAEAMTPWEWHAKLRDVARAKGLVFFSTPFDPTATELLEELDVPVHKIASFEIVDLPLVQHVARRGKPMIISTGMASLADIEAAVQACRSVGNDALALLRCVSAYPAQPASMHLRNLEVLRGLGTVVGLSDHTRDATAAVAAVALGARIVEKHFIVDRSLGGPDAFFSLEPEEFRTMVRAIRATEAALGETRFGPSEEERASTAFRRSLFFARDVRAGEVLTHESVRSVRPAGGLPTRHLYEVLGRTAARDVSAGTPVAWEAIGAPPRQRVELRAATREDAKPLFAWRDDPTTRAMSVSKAPFTYESHVAWLDAALASKDRAIFIATHEGASIGQTRVDRVAGTTWEVSIGVAPEARGRGFAAPLLRALEAAALERGVELLTARIREENSRSVRAFERAGYSAFVRRAVDGEAYVFCERRIAAFP